MGIRTNGNLGQHFQKQATKLGPILSKQNIVIAQVGEEKDPSMSGTYSSKGQTTLNQRAYVIRNGLLHLGPDNISVDLASYYDRKIVVIYGNCLSSHFSPFWSKSSQVSLLEPERKNKPCYSHDENPKSINKISPKKIAKETCRLLGIDFDYPYWHTLQDIPENCSIPTLKMIGTLMCEFIYRKNYENK